MNVEHEEEPKEAQGVVSDDGDDGTPNRSRQSQADKLVELSENVELFHQDVDEPFASIKVGDHVETFGALTKDFRRWLSREYWRVYKKTPSSQAFQDALNVICGKAIHDGPQHNVHVRIGEHAGKLYLDLGDDTWRAVQITAGAWSVIKDVPVKFIRPRGMLPIPEPRRGGSLDELRPFMNLANEDAFALIKAFLVSTLRPNRPFAFLVLTGEQGSGKTSLSIKLKSLIDSGKAPVRGLPRELRDLAIAAGNGWLLAFDNVSSIPQWTSDALCTLSTGGGFTTRELYSNSDEKIFDYQRPLILNGIGDIVTRPDLLDRCIVLQLPIISERHRRQELELNRQFEKARPRILGALLDAVVAALRNVESTQLESLPRMADFATFGVAAESAHSREPIFLSAYMSNRANLNQIAIDTSTIGPPLLAIMDGQSRWEGMLGALLELINAQVPDSAKKSKSWPALPRQLKSELTRLAPNLRQVGIEVTFGKRTNKGIPVTLEQSGKSSSLSTPSSKSSPTNGKSGDDELRRINTDQHSSTPWRRDKPFDSNVRADRDDSDDGLQHLSSLREKRL